MKYKTKIHPSKKLCIQYDENNTPVVLYIFDAKAGEGNHITIDKIVTLEAPEYYLLPKLPKGPLSDNWVGIDYSIRIDCFNDVGNASIIFTGNNVKLKTGYKMSSDTLYFILSSGQSMYGVVPFCEPWGHLVISNREPKYDNVAKLDKRLVKNPELYGVSSDIEISFREIYNPQTKEIELKSLNEREAILGL